VGASGVPTGDQVNADGTQTLSFYAEDVGDFAWAASPNFNVTTGTFLSSMGPVEIRVLALAAHPGAGARYMKIMQTTMEQFDRRFGPYPYKTITVIDPEPGSEIFGMEYPTLITAGTSWFDPTHGTEEVTEHEFGHQYWYGMVATNEFEDAWLDEGLVHRGECAGGDPRFEDKPVRGKVGERLGRGPAVYGVHRRARLRPGGAPRVAVSRWRLLRRHHLREERGIAEDARGHRRARHDG
jgi:hypothetical protein